ncbi:MAG TPA: STAS/SEC14 domain-containing protein [Candidatus Acidoferrales bacterium]|nr:STAS/SEC14 domain-containing protein [Candidatus Acidoferrales bacterium]
MPVEIRAEGKSLLVARVSGTLLRAEMDECQNALAKMIAAAGKASALVILDGFQGWERGGQWGDVSFLMEHDSQIDKMAIVGEEKWRDEVLVFAGDGIRRSPVRYFTDAAQARSWLSGKA